MSGYRGAAVFLGLGLLWGGSFAAIRYDPAGAVLLAYAVLAADRAA